MPLVVKEIVQSASSSENFLNKVDIESQVCNDRSTENLIKIEQAEKLNEPGYPRYGEYQTKSSIILIGVVFGITITLVSFFIFKLTAENFKFMD